MLANFLTIIFIFTSPFVFLIGQSVSSWLTISKTSSPNNSFLEIESQWDEWKKWQESLISTLWSANPNFLPIRDWDIAEPKIEAKAALIFELNKNKILYQKNIEQVLPIASLTKLMTALIVLEKMDLEEAIIISKEALAAYGDKGDLVLNEKISVKNLLYILLIESSNDAAIALAEYYQQKTGNDFVSLMNKKAEELTIAKTFFADPSGYNLANVSTAKEVVELIRYSFSQPIIWQILRTPTISLSSIDGQINHYLVNTDELLNRLPNIIGGKTGYTEEAQGCLALVIKKEPSYLITSGESERLAIVILGAQERFLQTEKLIDWVNKAYQW